MPWAIRLSDIGAVAAFIRSEFRTLIMSATPPSDRPVFQPRQIVIAALALIIASAATLTSGGERWDRVKYWTAENWKPVAVCAVAGVAASWLAESGDKWRYSERADTRQLTKSEARKAYPYQTGSLIDGIGTVTVYDIGTDRQRVRQFDHSERAAIGLAAFSLCRFTATR